MPLERAALELVELANTAARGKLGTEALELAEQGSRSIRSAHDLVQTVDDVSAKVLAAIRGTDGKANLTELFSYFGEPTSESSFTALRQLPAEGMAPAASKVLTTDGFSPNFGKSLQWSLPRLQNGKWIPGDWMDVSHQSFGFNGIYVSHDAERWLSYYGKPGHAPVQAFKVQIGDAVSRNLWEHPLPGMDRNNFAAKTVRLLEPLDAKIKSRDRLYKTL